MIFITLWNRFQWKTAVLTPSPALKEPFSVRRARAEEKEAVEQVALLSLKMNTEWHDATTIASNYIREGIQQSFANSEEPSCLVISHGQRIIGVSMLDVRPEASYHLLSGPWVLMEYRNRGFGTALLYASLQELARCGITEAYGMTRRNTVSARFVYSKFGGIMGDAVSPVILSEEGKNN